MHEEPKKIEDGVQKIGDDDAAVDYCNAVADAGFEELEEYCNESSEVTVENLTIELDAYYNRLKEKYPDIGLPEL